MNKIYAHPKYYEIAFSFVDIKKQIDLLEKFLNKHSEVKVKRVLDIGCGPSLQLREFVHRGYQGIGMDICKPMLEYLTKKAKHENLEIKTLCADMTDFNFKKKVDLALIMMGTIGDFKSNQDLYKHLTCVGNALKKGGLYIIENATLDWRPKTILKPQIWTIEKNNIKVKTTFKLEILDLVKQELLETLEIKITDGNKKKEFVEKSRRKLIFPQEFMEIVNKTNKFKLLGYFKKSSEIVKMKKANNSNYLLLKKV